MAHNDFGPNNVLIGLEAAKQGKVEVKVIDFGAASEYKYPHLKKDIEMMKNYFITRISPKSLPKFRRAEYKREV